MISVSKRSFKFCASFASLKEVLMFTYEMNKLKIYKPKRNDELVNVTISLLACDSTACLKDTMKCIHHTTALHIDGKRN